MKIEEVQSTTKKHRITLALKALALSQWRSNAFGCWVRRSGICKGSTGAEKTALALGISQELGDKMRLCKLQKKPFESVATSSRLQKIVYMPSTPAHF